MMNRELEIWVPGIPRGQARARSRIVRPKHSSGTGFVMHYKDAKQKQAEAQLVEGLSPHHPGRVISGPVMIDVEARFPVPKSWSKKRKAAALAGEIPHTKKPDIDNILKHVIDVMNGWWIEDDKQVVACSCRRCYSAEPGYMVHFGWKDK